MKLVLKVVFVVLTTSGRHRSGLLVNARLIRGRILGTQIFEVVAVERLLCRHPLVRIVNQQLPDQLLTLHRHVRDELGDPSTCRMGEVKLDVGRVFLEAVQEFAGRGAEDIVDFVDLIFFVVTREEREETEHLEEDAANPPYVHLVVVVPVS